MTMGVYGVDLRNDGSWASLRQNLPLIVDGGQPVVSTAREVGISAIYWGLNYGGIKMDLRSALCLRPDGLMMYAVVGLVDIYGLADALVSAGCVRAMELDMNGNWPQFIAPRHRHPGAGPMVPLDGRMSHLDRYFTSGAKKDFFALFDPAALPANAVR